MSDYAEPSERLIDEFRKLPGIGSIILCRRGLGICFGFRLCQRYLDGMPDNPGGSLGYGLEVVFNLAPGKIACGSRLQNQAIAAEFGAFPILHQGFKGFSSDRGRDFEEQVSRIGADRGRGGWRIRRRRVRARRLRP